jgi:hypothetical protein
MFLLLFLNSSNLDKLLANFIFYFFSNFAEVKPIDGKRVLSNLAGFFPVFHPSSELSKSGYFIVTKGK